MKTILVTGGAGYIGSHAVKLLVEQGRRVVVVDNLCRGYRAAVHPSAAFAYCDLCDEAGITSTLRGHGVDAVLHFAALAQVAESVQNPLDYYEANVVGTISLLRAMKRAGVSSLIFSSTCAVYGSPTACEVSEAVPANPLNPYGRSKLMAEHAVADFAASEPSFRYATFRYFNVAGAATDGSLGEETVPQSRIIPSLICATLGRRPPIDVFGDDYTTPDGTCIRDYVHVEDLVRAHVLALDRMPQVNGRVLNLGSGRGYSVREVIDTMERVVGRPVPTRIGRRRDGDAVAIWSSYARAQEMLGWRPSLGLEAMIESAWRWYRDRPNGYGSSFVT